MRFETSNPDLYKKVCQGRSLEKRINEIREAYRLGYLVTTGSLIGIPGQRAEDILNDIKLASELHAEMMSFGPFISHPETPLRQIPSVDEETMLKVISVARIIAHHDAKVLVTTAFETISANARIKGLKAGASSVMLNATPMSYRKFYSLYPNRAHDNETIQQQIDDTIKFLMTLGRAPTDLSVKYSYSPYNGHFGDFFNLFVVQRSPVSILILKLRIRSDSSFDSLVKPASTFKAIKRSSLRN